MHNRERNSRPITSHPSPDDQEHRSPRLTLVSSNGRTVADAPTQPTAEAGLAGRARADTRPPARSLRDRSGRTAAADRSATPRTRRNGALLPITGKWREFVTCFENRVVEPTAEGQFGELKHRLREVVPDLASFERPADLVTFLNEPVCDLDLKDRLYRHLVACVQQGNCVEIAWPILWLGMRPGLEAKYRRLQWRYRTAAKSGVLAELFAFHFSELVGSLRLDRVNRVAMALSWSTARDVRYDLDREVRHSPAARLPSSSDEPDEADVDGGDDHCDDGEDAHGGPTEQVQITARPTSRRKAPSYPGPDGALLFRELCGLLVELGGDIELINDVKVRGLTYEEAGEHRGLTKGAGRKQVDRVLRLGRKRLEREEDDRPLRKNRSK